MFGVGFGEFTVLLLVALLVVGPERLPGYAQQLGRLVREGRRVAMGLREQVREEIGPEFDDVDWRKLDPRQYDPRRIVRDALSDTWEDEPPAASRAARESPTKRPKPSGSTAAGARTGGFRATGPRSTGGAEGTREGTSDGTTGATTGGASASDGDAGATPFDADAT